MIYHKIDHLEPYQFVHVRSFGLSVEVQAVNDQTCDSYNYIFEQFLSLISAFLVKGGF